MSYYICICIIVHLALVVTAKVHILPHIISASHIEGAHCFWERWVRRTRALLNVAIAAAVVLISRVAVSPEAAAVSSWAPIL